MPEKTKTKTKTRIRYDKNLLDSYVEEHNIKLIGDYSGKIIGNTKVKGYCVTNDCNEVFEKSFANLYKTTALCYSCLRARDNYTNKVVRYDTDLLKKYGEEHNIIYIGTYTDTNLRTPIKGYCVTEGCNNIFEKTFKRMHCNGGPYCVSCTKINCRKKTHETNLRVYGYEETLQSPVVREKIEKTNLKNFGGTNPGQSPEVKKKIAETNMKKRGVACVFQDKNVVKQIKETNIKKRGVSNPSQCPEVLEKRKNTNMERYGVEHTFQSEIVKEKCEKAHLINLGVKNPGQSPIIKEKIQRTNIETWGVPCVLQNEIIKEKGRQTCIKKYGVPNPFQSEIVREKYKATNLKRRGVEHVMQDPKVHAKACKKSFSTKEYVLPSGKVIDIQGYEHFALDELLEYIDEDDITNGSESVPEIYYELYNKMHRHYVDIFVPKDNKCIEVKSDFTYNIDKNKVHAKLNGAKKLGLKYEIWVYNRKGEKVKFFD